MAIKIKESRKGTFTAAAKKRGKSIHQKWLLKQTLPRTQEPLNIRKNEL